MAVIFIFFNNCTKKEDKKTSSKMVENTSTTSSTIDKKPTIAVNKSTLEIKKTAFSNTLEVKTTNGEITPKTAPSKPKMVSANNKIYINLSKIINSLKIGQTVNTEQLLATKKIPEDAGKSVKSITKVSTTEMDIKWKSKWMIEKVSDVELEDSRLKVVFKDGIVYTSGNAIGIDYDGKVYKTLIIKGDRAYIPGVKKYSWKIGR